MRRSAKRVFIFIHACYQLNSIFISKAHVKTTELDQSAAHCTKDNKKIKSKKTSTGHYFSTRELVVPYSAFRFSLCVCAHFQFLDLHLFFFFYSGLQYFCHILDLIDYGSFLTLHVFFCLFWTQRSREYDLPIRVLSSNSLRAASM